MPDPAQPDPLPSPQADGLPATMRAAFVERLGRPEEIRVGELPLPVPGPEDVLVRVEASAVDPVDGFVRSGAYRTPTPFPFVIGRDLMGREVGTGRRVWSHSMGHGGRQGAAAEYAAVPRDRLYPVPDGVDAEQFLAALHPAATAVLALEVHGDLGTGETVFVGGGAGNVGRMALAVARQAVSRAGRVVATASARDLALCRELGADSALDYRDPGLGRALADALEPGADVHLDTSGRHDLDRAVDLLAPRGRIVLMAGLGARPALPVGPLYTRDGSVRGFAISNATVEELALTAARISALASQGLLPDLRLRRLPLGEARRAHEELEAGRLHGIRTVLRH